MRQVDDKAYQINVLNSHNLEYRLKLDVVETKMEEGNSQGFQEPLAGNNQEDEEIQAIKETLESGNVPKTWTDIYLVQDGLVYNLFGKDEDIRPRLYVSKIIRVHILKECHDNMGHLGIDKTHDLISRKYYWPGLYKKINKYINACMICQSRSSKQNASPLLETDIPSYPFQKISMDISGPNGETSQGNIYIVSFVDLLSNLPEAFAVSDKKAQTIADLILTGKFPRYGAPLQLVTDKGKGNVNEVMRETLHSLNIQHITTSPYHLQSNAKVERFHRFLGDVLSKLTGGNCRD